MAKAAIPEGFVDIRFVIELDQTGDIDKL